MVIRHSKIIIKSEWFKGFIKLRIEKGVPNLTGITMHRARQGTEPLGMAGRRHRRGRKNTRTHADRKGRARRAKDCFTDIIRGDRSPRRGREDRRKRRLTKGEQTRESERKGKGTIWVQSDTPARGIQNSKVGVISGRVQIA